MKLQILVCQYLEDESTIEPLLRSIAMQRGVDIKNDVEVIICNDGSDVILSDAYLAGFPYKIQYHMEPHRGLYATRNACMEHATADYVMFCDADDMFCDVLGLQVIFSEMGKPFDILNSPFVEEVKSTGGKMRYVVHDNDVRFVHGKVYRREFILQNRLRFNGDLKVHGDSYFLTTADAICENSRSAKQAFYMWCWRDGSICRKSRNHVLNTYVNLIDSQDAVVDNLVERGCTRKAMECASGLVYGSFYNINSTGWQAQPALMEKAERRLKAFMDKHKELIQNIPDEIERQVIVGARNRAFAEGVMMERITLQDWIRHIKTL